MATLNDVRRIAAKLPGAVEEPDRFAFSVGGGAGKKGKHFVWSWLERVDPKKARVENRAVMAVRVGSLDEKEALLAGNPGKLFTEPHYNGYPAVLLRLKDVTVAELRELVTAAWEVVAPKAKKTQRR